VDLYSALGYKTSNVLLDIKQDGLKKLFNMLYLSAKIGKHRIFVVGFRVILPIGLIAVCVFLFYCFISVSFVL